MKIEQLYTKCLSEASYYIESNGEAAVIDPIRESDPYIEMVQDDNARLKYVFETHFHADFVSGHIDLAKKTGASIVFGPKAEPGYDAKVSTDGQVYKIGDITIEVLHTPGHTPESTTYLLKDENGEDYAVFTGDTLFIGDVGRPDLAVKSDLTEKDLAGMLYDSLHKKIMPLNDKVIVYPGHGAGSACGKNIGKETQSTIGQQKQMNYALQDMSKEKFIEVVTEGLMAPPKYFFEDARINKEGYEAIDEVLERNIKPLSVDEVEKASYMDHVIILDTRTPDEFEKGYIPGSINIGLSGQFAIWAGTLIPIDKSVIVITDEGKEKETILRLARVGYEKVGGFLEGGFDSWLSAGREVEKMESIDAEEAVKKINSQELPVVDVRKPGETSASHIPGAKLITLQDLEENLDQLDKDQAYLVHCAGGYRSMMAASIMKRNGYVNPVNVRGGYKALQENGVQCNEGVCETTLRNQKLEAK